jgi:hypothetical protein
MNKVLPIDEAKSLEFADLARIVRAHLSEGFKGEISETLIHTWIDILEAKIPLPPEKPQLIKLPELPEIPAEPIVEEPSHSPSSNYNAVRTHYSKLISGLTADMGGIGKKRQKPIKKKIGELQSQLQKALFEAKLSDLPKEIANRWLAQQTEHKQWQILKQKLLNKHNAQVKNIERQNSVRRKEWSNQVEAWKKLNEIPFRIVHNLRRDCKAAIQQPEQWSIRRLPWRFLPPSETNEERVLSILHDFCHRCPGIRVDESRLRYAYSLKPEQIFIGEDEFDGYFAFVFAGGIKVLLENPIEGNAAYIFGQDWKLLSKLPKSELLAYHHDHLIRVIHSSGWKSDVNRALRKLNPENFSV